ncbi:hypothetical protein Hypma_011223 [Hypsizygus marmoreus]|uniref:Uncharacterized protein n=1 Tax=Hypsizygus marmoreus TaxID=39966 RepID=A0A369JK76_HYPMA|nr:hypothetical protein Hypma_011223 [Hypsizygus marmoreus]
MHGRRRAKNPNLHIRAASPDSDAGCCTPPHQTENIPLFRLHPLPNGNVGWSTTYHPVSASPRKTTSRRWHAGTTGEQGNDVEHLPPTGDPDLCDTSWMDFAYLENLAETVVNPRRRRPADNPLLCWIQDRDTFVAEDIRWDGLGDYTMIECPCCGVHPPRFRCEDWLYRLFLGIDANFRLKRKLVSNWIKDPALGDGWAYFVQSSNFRDFLNTYGTLIIQDEELKLWEDDHRNPNPFETRYKSLTLDAVRRALAEQDAIEMANGDAYVLHEEVSASQLIITGLDLEEQQRRLVVDAAELVMAADEGIERGLHAYATQQAWQFRAMKARCQHVWRFVPQYVQIGLGIDVVPPELDTELDTIGEDTESTE